MLQDKITNEYYNLYTYQQKYSFGIFVVKLRLLKQQTFKS
jgi:ASC-1-like (ASCH) protein